MCLSAVDEKIAKPVALIESGWKSFHGSYSKPEFENFTWKGSKIVPLNKWITAEGDKIKDGPIFGSSYKSGFHIYDDEIDMKKMPSKRRVFYRNVVVRGKQDPHSCIVALEMYVPSNENEWPPRT